MTVPQKVYKAPPPMSVIAEIVNHVCAPKPVVARTMVTADTEDFLPASSSYGDSVQPLKNLLHVSLQIQAGSEVFCVDFRTTNQLNTPASIGTPEKRGTIVQQFLGRPHHIVERGRDPKTIGIPKLFQVFDTVMQWVKIGADIIQEIAIHYPGVIAGKDADDSL